MGTQKHDKHVDFKFRKPKFGIGDWDLRPPCLLGKPDQKGQGKQELAFGVVPLYAHNCVWSLHANDEVLATF